MRSDTEAGITRNAQESRSQRRKSVDSPDVGNEEFGSVTARARVRWRELEAFGGDFSSIGIVRWSSSAQP